MLQLNAQREVLQNAIDTENKKISVILSDETEVVRYSWSDGKYFLTLMHNTENVDLSRKDILPLFINHNTYTLPIGKFENVRLEDKKLKADALFDKDDEESMKIFNKLANGFLQSFSVGININEKVLQKEDENGIKYYNVTKWEIDEASVVGIPAIPNAKVGLQKEDETGENPASAEIKNQTQGELSMPEYTKEKFDALNVTHAEALKLGVATATKTERERISSILALSGSEDVKLSAINDGLTAGDCAIALNKANAEKIKKEQTDFAAAAEEVAGIDTPNSETEELTAEQAAIKADDEKFYKGAK